MREAFTLYFFYDHYYRFWNYGLIYVYVSTYTIFFLRMPPAICSVVIYDSLIVYIGTFFPRRLHFGLFSCLFAANVHRNINSWTSLKPCFIVEWKCTRTGNPGNMVYVSGGVFVVLLYRGNTKQADKEKKNKKKIDYRIPVKRGIFLCLKKKKSRYLCDKSIQISIYTKRNSCVRADIPNIYYYLTYVCTVYLRIISRTTGLHDLSHIIYRRCVWL